MEALKKRWEAFQAKEPGKRFEQHYHEKERAGRSTFRKIALIGAGLAVMAAGVIMLAIPGPGLLALFIGAGLIAEESLAAAKAMDWLEVRLRKAVNWALSIWKSASMPVRALLVLVALLLAAGATYGAYWWFFLR